MMHDQPIWQTCHLSRRRRSRQRPLAFAESLLEVVQRAAHSFPRQRVDVIGLGLVEKLSDIGGRDSVVFEAGFEPLQPECCQHQQRRNKRCEQPRHKGEVNTAKVSAGSRIVTGPHLSACGRVGPPQ